MVFRVLVFGDYMHDLDQLREYVEDINQWKGNHQPWEIVLPKCNDMLRKSKLDQLSVDERQDLFVRCAVSLDLEFPDFQSRDPLDSPTIDLIIGIRQGATFVVGSLTMIELRARTYLLIGGAAPEGDECSDWSNRLTSRIIFANHAKDLIDGCPSRELNRIDARYQETKKVLIQKTLEHKEAYFGYVTLPRQDIDSLLDQHRTLILDAEESKRKSRTKIPPLSHCFDPKMIVGSLMSDFVEVISDPKVIAVVSGLVKPGSR